MTSNSKRRGTRWALPCVAVIVALACAAITSWPPAHRPVATFRFGPDRVQVEPFDAVPKFDAMVLRIEMPFDGYVYLVSFDYLRGTVSYFPSEFLGTDHKHDDGRMNFFEAGTHDLPGPWDGKPQAWFVPDVEGALSLCVVVSRQVLTELEAILPATRQVGNTAFPNRAMSDYMPRAGRDSRVGKHRLPHDVLLAAQNQRDSIHAGPMVPWNGHENVFVKVLNIRPGLPRPGAQPPSNPLQDRLREFKKTTTKKK